MIPEELVNFNTFVEEYKKNNPSATPIMDQVTMIAQNALKGPEEDRQRALQDITKLLEILNPKEAENITYLAEQALGRAGRKRTAEEFETPEVETPKPKRPRVGHKDHYSTTFEALLQRPRGGRFTQGVLSVDPSGRGLVFGSKPSWKIWTWTESNPQEIAAVLKNEAMVSGLRRVFVAKSLRNPEEIKDERNLIAEALRYYLQAGEVREQEIETIVQRVVGTTSFQRSSAPLADKAEDLLSPKEALSDIRDIIDSAAKTQDPETARALVQEAFSYILPVSNRPKEIDEQLQKGMDILLERKISLNTAFEIFKNSSPIDRPITTTINQFLPLILKSLAKVETPYVYLQQLMELLASLPLPEEAKKALALMNSFIVEIGKTRNRDVDACFVCVPLLVRMTQTFPDSIPEDFTDTLKECTAMLVEKRPHGELKESIPGLTALNYLIAKFDENIEELYKLRPPTYRTGNEEQDFALFFHHIIQTARYAKTFQKNVLEKALTLLKNRPSMAAYLPTLDDMSRVLEQEKPGNDAIGNKLLPLLDALMPKMRLDLRISPEQAQQQILSVTLDAASSATHPAEMLKNSKIIMQRVKEEGGADLIPVFQTLLSTLSTLPQENAIVQNFINPLLSHLVLGNKPPLDQTFIANQLNDVLYLLAWPESQDMLASQLKGKSILEDSKSIFQIRLKMVDNLLKNAALTMAPAAELRDNFQMLDKELPDPEYTSFKHTLKPFLNSLVNKPDEELKLLHGIIIPLLRQTIPNIAETASHLDCSTLLAELILLAPSLGGRAHPQIDILSKINIINFESNLPELDRLTTERLEMIKAEILQKAEQLIAGGAYVREAAFQNAFMEGLSKICGFVPDQLNMDILQRVKTLFFETEGPMKQEVLPALKEAKLENISPLYRDILEIIRSW